MARFSFGKPCGPAASLLEESYFDSELRDTTRRLANVSTMSSTDRMVVVAIDFGTTYSGYAYSFRSDYKVNPMKVFTQNFQVGSTRMPKMPTSVLFKPNQKFHSFGTEAEEKYARLCVQDSREARRWYFFQRFKLELHMSETVNRDMMLLDETKKKELPAIRVFSCAIGFMKKHFIDELLKQGTFVEDSDITWVLTVPAIWDDKAKSFMREAAEEAGIAGDQLVLALEPEAASVYCLESYKSQQTASQPFSISQSGIKFMAVDCGGGTVDVSVFKVQGGGKLRHLHRAEGTCQGGTKVDDAFKDFLHRLLGVDGLTSIDRLEMLKLMREFETAKRAEATSQKIAIKMPGTIKIVVTDAISKSAEFRDKVSTLFNKLMLNRDVFLSFFTTSATSIVKTLRKILAQRKVGRVDAILLAGGFSESVIIQDAVKKAFPRDLVLVAPSPSAAVLTGAVMYGHNPDVIATRVSAFTYGVDCCPPFRDGVHDKARLVIEEDGKRRCDDCFDVYIHIDQEVEVNTLLPYQAYRPVRADQSAVGFSIYRSSKKKPLYVDEEGCEKIGHVRVPMPDTTGGRKRKVKAAMMVGGTELKFFATDETTQKEFSVNCDFLAKN